MVVIEEHIVRRVGESWEIVTRVVSEEQKDTRVGESREIVDEHQNCSSLSLQSDLALCDFWLLLNLKETPRSSCFGNSKKMKEVVTNDLDIFTS